MDDILRHWPIIGFFLGLAINLGIGWVLWSLAAKFATKGDIDELKKNVGDQVAGVSNQVATVRSRVDIIENEMKHLPTSAALHETNVQLTKLLGAIEATGRDYRHVFDRQTRLEDATSLHANILSDAARMTARARNRRERRDNDERP